MNCQGAVIIKSKNVRKLFVGIRFKSTMPVPPYGGRAYNSPYDRALHGWCETNCRTISFMFGSSGVVNYKYS